MHRAGPSRVGPRLGAGELDELCGLALQARQFRGDDRHVDQDEHEDDGVGSGDQLALAPAHCNTSRSSRRLASSRLPASSTRYRTYASNVTAPQHTTNVENIVALI